MTQVILARVKKDSKIHYKLISAFDGSTTSPSIVEMVKEAELLCWMCGMKWSEHGFPFEANKSGVCCLPGHKRRREGGHRMKNCLVYSFCDGFIGGKITAAWRANICVSSRMKKVLSSVKRYH